MSRTYVIIVTFAWMGCGSRYNQINAANAALALAWTVPVTAAYLGVQANTTRRVADRMKPVATEAVHYDRGGPSSAFVISGDHGVALPLSRRAPDLSLLEERWQERFTLRCAKKRLCTGPRCKERRWYALGCDRSTSRCSYRTGSHLEFFCDGLDCRAALSEIDAWCRE